jgi:photosystem II stability/assembly factor-like uncharacterized protein
MINMKIQSFYRRVNSSRLTAPGLVIGIAIQLATSALVHAAPVADAFTRPSTMARNATRSVLLGSALAGKRLITVGERGIILLSDDQGITWRQVASPVSVTLVAVRFADSKNGFVVGHGGTVLATKDGGETWTQALDGKRLAQISLDAAKDSGDTSAIRVAERLVADGPDKPLLDLWVFNANNAIAVGAYGLAASTSDGGQTWQSQMPMLENPKGLHLYSIRAQGNRLVIAGEQGLLFRSSDSGASYQKLPSPYKGSFFTAEIPTDKTIVVAGLRGNIWRSTDDGKTWSQVPTRLPVNLTGSTIRPDGTVVLVDQSGSISLLREGQIVPSSAQPQPPINAVTALPDGGLLTVGIQGSYVIPAANLKTPGASN